MSDKIRKPQDEVFSEPEVNLLSEREKRKKFLGLPSSPATDSVLLSLGYAQDLDLLSERRESINHDETVTVRRGKNGSKKRQITFETSSASSTITFTDIDKLLSSNKPAKKFFLYFLILLNDQALADGKLRNDYIEFSYRDLVDLGFYGSADAARRSFNTSVDALQSLKLKGTLKIKKDKTIEQVRDAVLFPIIDRFPGQGVVRVHLSVDFEWALLCQFFTLLPRYAFSLGNRAFDLSYYISMIARQRTKDIESRGYFTITMRAIQERLHLPSEVGNSDPLRTIKDPIDDAISEIELHEEGNEEPSYTVTPMYNMSDPIAAFLDKGYLKIEPKGQFADYLKALRKESQKKIESAQRRKEKIVDAAKAKNLSEKMKAEEKKKLSEDGSGS